FRSAVATEFVAEISLLPERFLATTARNDSSCKVGTSLQPLTSNFQLLTSMDPILFQVLRSALVEATEEMTLSLKRSAYSTNIKTRADFSCAFFDRQLRTVAQASGQPVHLGSLSHFVPSVI